MFNKHEEGRVSSHIGPSMYNFTSPKKVKSFVFIMIPSHYARIIMVLGVFKTFTCCGISSNTLLMYLFICVYLQVGLLISALGFTDDF
jgi:hypothetical protein